MLGAHRERPDALAKVSGATLYTADVALRDALVGMVLRSPHPFARIKRIDTQLAGALPGVLAIAHAGTVPDKRLDFSIKDQQLFPKTYARYAGEPVAAVAAESVTQARAALDAIVVEYEPLEPLLTIEAALGANAPLVHPDWQTYEKSDSRVLRGNICGYNRIRRGDVDAAFAAADAVVESEYRLAPSAPGYIEPRAAAARREPDGGLTVWCGSQSPYGNRDELAAFFDLDPTKVRFINQFVGGAFGGKILMATEWYAAALALQCARPVRVVWSRHEDQLNVFPRHGGFARLKSGAKADGTLLGMRASFFFNTGAYIGYGSGTALIATMLASAPYRIPNLDLEATLVYTNAQVAGPVRAPGGPQANFVKESHLDELARKLDIDPLEFRLKNAWVDGDVSPSGQKLTSVSVKETLRRAAAAIGWGKDLGTDRGRGLAATWWFSSCGGSKARVAALENGRVRVASGNPEVGTGSAAAALPIIVADVLGIDPSRIDMELADTATGTYDSGVGGSGSTFSAGQAVEAAAVRVRQKLLERAEQMLEARAEDLVLEGGRAFVRGTDGPGISLERLVQSAGGEVSEAGEAPELGDPEIDESLVETHEFAAWLAPSFTATAAQVEVDRETGRVSVEKIATAQDVGFAINPTGVVGQIEGGATQALGYALTEELKFDERGLVNANFKDYLLPTAVDAPSIEAIIVQSPSEEGPHGMKGAGEPPVTTPAAAIANAVRDAVGTAPNEIPMTPERVWQALQSAQRHSAGKRSRSTATP